MRFLSGQATDREDYPFVLGNAQLPAQGRYRVGVRLAPRTNRIVLHEDIGLAQLRCRGQFASERVADGDDAVRFWQRPAIEPVV